MRWVSLLSVDRTQIPGKLALTEDTWCNDNHCCQSVRVLIRRKCHSLGIRRLHVLRETFDENSLELFIYDIPTRPTVMFGELKMHEIHPC